MAVDLSVDLISATVQVEQPLAGGTRTVGTGFLVSDPTPDGRPRIVLITAKHVFESMPGEKATIGYRIQGADGAWRFAPQEIVIRQSGKELWTDHPTRDVAASTVAAPPAFARAAIPLAWLATDQAFAKYQLEPGDEMMALGFPQGLSANSAGFPILRSGRVASYPLAPSTEFPTFLLDFRVFPGNSGGPVYLDEPTTAGSTPAGAQPAEAVPCIAGILTQEVELGHENLGIGIVTDARFIRETLGELDGAPADPRTSPAAVAAVASAYAAETAARSP
ncbi:MAG: S1 family peptidase [Caulobacteraceae bacterium]